MKLNRLLRPILEDKEPDKEPEEDEKEAEEEEAPAVPPPPPAPVRKPPKPGSLEQEIARMGHELFGGEVEEPEEEPEEDEFPITMDDEEEDDIPTVKPEPEEEPEEESEVPDKDAEVYADMEEIHKKSLAYQMRKLTKEIASRREFLADNAGKFGTGRETKLPWSDKTAKLTEDLEEDIEEEIRDRLRKLDKLQKTAENVDVLTGNETVKRDTGYKDKFRYWWGKATSVPGAISGLREALEYAMHDRFQSFAKFRSPEADAATPDRELVRLVAEGAKPVAHTRRDPAFIEVPEDIEDDVAFIKYPGGGAVWYKPYRTFFRGRKGFAQRPYDPYGSEADDPNQNMAKAYLWNNMVAKNIDPQVHHFINGILLGYPRDFVVDFVETDSAMDIQDVHPEKSLWQKMIDRMKEHMRSWISGDGTPGSIMGDSWVTRTLKRFTPESVKNMYDDILTDMEERPYSDFAGTQRKTEQKTESPDLEQELSSILSP